MPYSTAVAFAYTVMKRLVSNDVLIWKQIWKVCGLRSWSKSTVPWWDVHTVHQISQWLTGMHSKPTSKRQCREHSRAQFSSETSMWTMPIHLASHANHLHSTLTHCNLFNHVSQPTRVPSSSASVIDLFLSNVPIEGVLRTVYVDMSDHFAILAHMPGFGMGKAYSGHPAAKRQRRRLHRINWNTFNEDLNHHLATCTFTGNLENAVQSLTTSIIIYPGCACTIDSSAPTGETSLPLAYTGASCRGS